MLERYFPDTGNESEPVPYTTPEVIAEAALRDIQSDHEALLAGVVVTPATLAQTIRRAGEETISFAVINKRKEVIERRYIYPRTVL